VPELPLYESRERLRTAFDEEWCEIGPELPAIARREDVPRVLRALTPFASQIKTVEFLLLELDIQVETGIRAQWGDAAAVQPMTRHFRVIQKQLNASTIVPCGPLVSSVVQDQADTAEIERKISTSQRLRKLLKEEQSFFTQQEFLRFVTKKRYEISPLNLGSAFAAVPVTGWRRSMAMCLELANRPGFQDSLDIRFSTYKAVQQVVNYIDSRLDRTAIDVSELKLLATVGLRAAKTYPNSRLKDLKNNRDAFIEAVVCGYTGSHGIHLRPYMITREFFILSPQIRNKRRKIEE
jgi:hypothetical protein